jgi:hypothetical protein
MVPPMRDARFVDLILAVFMCNSWWDAGVVGYFDCGKPFARCSARFASLSQVASVR